MALGRPFAAPPDIPADRFALLRKAFSDTFVDQAFLADCAKQGLECDAPSSGEQIQNIVAEAYKASPDVIARLRKIYASRL
jgi:hypothetical protein